MGIIENVPKSKTLGLEKMKKKNRKCKENKRKKSNHYIIQTSIFYREKNINYQNDYNFVT